ncbi:MAG: DNA adenine methylase [Bacteroidota bacterium]
MKSFLNYLGGKSRLVNTIVPKIPPHSCYCEPFAGASWLMFAKDESASKSEVLNDINSDVINLYRVVKHHLDEFVRYLRWILLAREEYDRWKITPAETLTDVQRAVRFYYLMRLGYGGRVNSHHVGVSPTRRPGFNLLRTEEELSAVHLRLARVWIEHMAYADVIQRYDRPDTFFYLDPPYCGFEDDYGKGLFARADFERLRAILSGLEGKFLLSINDVPYIRETFAEFTIEPVKTEWAMRKKDKAVGELLISNYHM